jgi:hypothetical protein
MGRILGLPRLAAGLAGAQLAVFLAAACGGSDTIDQPDAAVADGHAPDGEMPDSPGSDATMHDSGSQDADSATAADSSQLDAESGSGDADTGMVDADGGPEDGGLDGTDGTPGDGAIEDADAAAGDGGDAALDADAQGDAPSDAPMEADADGGIFDSGTGGLMQSLFTASSFVALGGATVTNSGVNTVLIGDVGTTGPSITGLTGPPFQPSGTTDVHNAVATQAVLDLGTAYVSLTGQACPPANHLTGMDLGGKTLAPGVYCFTSSAGQLTGTTLTFDAQGDPNAVWIIQVATQLTIMDSATAVVIGGPPSLACRIFWTTGTAAVINGGANFVGNVLASSQTSLLTNATLSPGRAFGITAGVTLLSNTISAAACP